MLKHLLVFILFTLCYTAVNAQTVADSLRKDTTVDEALTRPHSDSVIKHVIIDTFVKKIAADTVVKHSPADSAAKSAAMENEMKKALRDSIAKLQNTDNVVKRVSADSLVKQSPADSITRKVPAADNVVKHVTTDTVVQHLAVDSVAKHPVTDSAAVIPPAPVPVIIKPPVITHPAVKPVITPAPAEATIKHSPVKTISDMRYNAYLKGNDLDSMALAAEMNHYPLPDKALKYKAQIGLNPGQITKLKELAATLHRKRVEMGENIIRNEKMLDSLFHSKQIVDGTLIFYTNRSGLYYGELKGAILMACYETERILSDDQVKKLEALEKNN